MFVIPWSTGKRFTFHQWFLSDILFLNFFPHWWQWESCSKWLFLTWVVKSFLQLKALSHVEQTCSKSSLGSSFMSISLSLVLSDPCRTHQDPEEDVWRVKLFRVQWQVYWLTLILRKMVDVIIVKMIGISDIVSILAVFPGVLHASISTRSVLQRSSDTKRSTTTITLTWTSRCILRLVT